MTFGAGSTFGSLSPWMVNRGQTPVQRPTGPTNLAQQMMGGQQGQGFGSFSPMPQQQAATAQPSAGGRIPISGLGGPGLQALFAEADKAAASTGPNENAPPSQFLTGSPPKTAEEAWAQQRADQAYLDKLNYQNAVKAWASGGGQGPEPSAAAGAMMPNMLKLQKELFMRNYNGASGMSPGTTEASAAAQKEAQAFLTSLGL